MTDHDFFAAMAVGIPHTLANAKAIGHTPEQARTELAFKQPSGRVQALHDGALTRTQELLRLGRSKQRVLQHLLRVLPLKRLPVNKSGDAVPVVGDLTNQETSLGERLSNDSKLIYIGAELRDTSGHFQRFSILSIGDGHHHLEVVELDGLGQYPNVHAPCPNRPEQLHSDPAGAPLKLLLASSSIERRKRECANYSTDRPYCGPGVPPHNAIALTRWPACTEAIPPAHSLIPLWTGGHSAMPIRPEEMAHG